MMLKASSRPHWALPPGKTIQKILEKNKISSHEFGVAMSLRDRDVDQLLRGSVAIDGVLAERLSSVLGSTKNFWMNRERLYREAEESVAKLEEDQKDWISRIPLRDMAQFNWVAKQRGLKAQVEALYNFFDVASVDDWYEKYQAALSVAAFRTSDKFGASNESVIAWLRRGEIAAQEMRVNKKWSPSRLESQISELRVLTRESDPGLFIPALKDLLASCGVAFVAQPTPSKCPASGAAYSAGGVPIILLSFRYYSDDQFWFTVFHEIGHLMLHGENRIFIEGDALVPQKEEDEANAFAERTLIPSAYVGEFESLNAKSWRRIPRFAKKIGVSPGIVVGQLQKRGIIRYNQLNALKVRYDKTVIWSSHK